MLALALMAQPASPGPSQSASSSPARPKLSEAILTSERTTSANRLSIEGAGSDIALHVVESALVDGEVSAQTNRLIHKQLADLPAASSTDTLNLLTALVMGSPEFQLR